MIKNIIKFYFCPNYPFEPLILNIDLLISKMDHLIDGVAEIRKSLDDQGQNHTSEE